MTSPSSIGPCGGPAPERLSDWLDRRLPSPRQNAEIEAHLEQCGECAARVAELRALKSCLARFATGGNPAAVPASVRASLAERIANGGMRARTPTRFSPVWPVAAAAAIGVVAIATTLNQLRGTQTLKPGLAEFGMIAQSTGKWGDKLKTNDPLRCSVWLSENLGLELSALNAALLGYRITGAAASPDFRTGALFLKSKAGVPATLLIAAGRPFGTEDAEKVQREGQTLYLPASGNMAAWHSRDGSFVLSSVAARDELLRLAQELSRQCAPAQDESLEVR